MSSDSRVRVPAAVLRFVLRGQADLFLHGRVAVPARARELGYEFLDPTFRDAAARALGR